MKKQHPERNRPGGAMHLSIVILILALAGAWFLYTSFKKGSLREDLAGIFQDLRKAASTLMEGKERKEQ